MGCETSDDVRIHWMLSERLYTYGTVTMVQRQFVDRMGTEIVVVQCCEIRSKS